MHLIPVISYYFLPFVNANSEIIGNLYSLPTPGSHSGSFAGPFADSGWWLGSSYKTLLLLTEAMNTQILCLVKDTSRSVIILTICGLWYIYGNVVVHRFFVFSVFFSPWFTLFAARLLNVGVRIKTSLPKDGSFGHAKGDRSVREIHAGCRWCRWCRGLHQGLVIYFLDPPVLDLDFTQLASMAELELSATRSNSELGGTTGQWTMSWTTMMPWNVFNVFAHVFAHVNVWGTGSDPHLWETHCQPTGAAQCLVPPFLEGWCLAEGLVAWWDAVPLSLRISFEHVWTVF